MMNKKRKKNVKKKKGRSSRKVKRKMTNLMKLLNCLKNNLNIIETSI